jgi:hypothetical protein
MFSLRVIQLSVELTIQLLRLLVAVTVPDVSAVTAAKLAKTGRKAPGTEPNARVGKQSARWGGERCRINLPITGGSTRTEAVTTFNWPGVGDIRAGLAECGGREAGNHPKCGYPSGGGDNTVKWDKVTKQFRVA